MSMYCEQCNRVAYDWRVATCKGTDGEPCARRKEQREAEEAAKRKDDWQNWQASHDYFTPDA